MSKYESKLASRCKGVAQLLSYNSGTSEGVAKHLLLEAAHILDSHAVRIHQKNDGLLLINARGKSRYMTMRERLAVWLLRGKTEIRP